MIIYLFVAVGSALGGVLRHWLSMLLGDWAGQSFPWGTLTVNVTGCFAVGFFAALTEASGPVFIPTEWRQFFIVGFCGGFTTFSSFSLQTLTLAQFGEWRSSAMNIGLSITLCLLSVWLGSLSALSLNR